MHGKYFNIGLLICSLLVYLEGGITPPKFLIELEWEVISTLFTDPLSVLHPFTLLPLIGQILICITLFQPKPNTLMTLLGIGCMGILIGLVFFIGIIETNVKIWGSTLPFIVLSIWTSRYHILRKGASITR